MQENKNIVLSQEQINDLRNNLQKPDIQGQIKNISNYKAIESLCKNPDQQTSDLMPNQYCLKLIELLSHEAVNHIDFKFLKDNMDSWIVKSNLKYVSDENNLRAIYKNIKENNKNKTPEEQKQNMLDFLNLCPQLMKVFEGEDLGLLCDEIVNKNCFVLSQVVALKPRVDHYCLRSLNPNRLIEFNNEAGDRFRSYLGGTYKACKENEAIKLRNVLYLYLGNNDAGLLLYNSGISEFKDDFCARKYQEDIKLCSKSLINICKLEQTRPDKHIFLSKLFCWKSILIAVELLLSILSILMFLGLDAIAIGTAIFIGFFGFVFLLDAIFGLFVPKKFIGSWILSKILVSNANTYDIRKKLSIDNLKKEVDNIITSEKITTCYNQFLGHIKSNANKTEFVNDVESYFKIKSFSDISDNEIEHFLDCGDYFILEKLNDYIKNNMFQQIKNNLKKKLLSRDNFNSNENYEAYQQAVGELFATDIINDIIETAYKKLTCAFFSPFTQNNKNDFREFMKSCITNEKKSPVTSRKSLTIESQKLIYQSEL